MSAPSLYDVLAPDRDGCCADWRKPCPYHDGWMDALEHADSYLGRTDGR